MSRSGSVSPAPALQPPPHSSSAAASVNEHAPGESALQHTLQQLRDSEQLYRRSCMSEEDTLVGQLAFVRASIQKLQVRLLEALEGDFEHEESTAHIHRELGLLLDVERSFVDRSYEVRERLVSSCHQELKAEIDLHEHFVKMQLSRDTRMHMDPHAQASPTGIA